MAKETANKSESAPKGVVTSSDSMKRENLTHAHGGWLKKFRSKKVALVATGIILLVAVVGAGLYTLKHKTAVKQAPTITSSQYSARQVKELKSQSLPATATNDEKISYYSTIVKEEYNSGNYTQALADYKQLMALIGTNIGYNDSLYLTGAKLYENAGDKQAALAELAKARQIDSNIPDQLLRSQMLTTIDNLQQEIQK